jgi:predicted DNA-binding transcriptional regulator AlpA
MEKNKMGSTNLTSNDRVIWRRELMGLLDVTSETVRRWLKDGRLPLPDVNLSQKTRGWRLSTLRKHGIRLSRN